MIDSTEEKLLDGRKLLLGVTGSIAAYKAAEVVRLFKKAGAEVQVLMTPDAARFITPLTLGTLSEREVLVEIFLEKAGSSEGGGSWTKHVSLGLWADLFVVAPATAQTLAKMAHGFSDTMLTATALTARCPLLLCPAMDHDMYHHPAT
ncbi:MAG: flavoprotein, partial [Rhodothermales bacterium]